MGKFTVGLLFISTLLTASVTVNIQSPTTKTVAGTLPLTLEQNQAPPAPCNKQHVQLLPVSSEVFSGVLVLRPVCSTSTWISSVSSMLFLVLFWMFPSDRGFFLSLRFFLSPGSLRSSRSSVEDRTGKDAEMLR